MVARRLPGFGAHAARLMPDVGVVHGEGAEAAALTLIGTLLPRDPQHARREAGMVDLVSAYCTLAFSTTDGATELRRALLEAVRGCGSSPPPALGPLLMLRLLTIPGPGPRLLLTSPGPDLRLLLTSLGPSAIRSYRMRST